MQLGKRFAPLLTLVAWMSNGQGAPNEVPTQTTPATPLMTLYGKHSGIKEPKLVRITSEKEWNDLWSAHQTAPSDRRICDLNDLRFDFNQVMVIAVFQGDGAFCRGYEFHSITEDQRRIVLRVHPLYFQLMPAVAARGGKLLGSQAWGVFVLPQSNKAIVLERDDRAMITSPPKWVRWTTFPPTSPQSERNP
jgi:hypothetical protein